MKSLVFLPTFLMVAGCAITQDVEPSTTSQGSEICIIENPDVRGRFLEVYLRELETKGFKTRVIPATSTLHDCPQVSRYTANWRWDVAYYLAFADISVYEDGKRVGHVVYDSLRGSLNLGKFVNGENKIVELVDQLFPQGPAVAQEAAP
jgi:hypothetical protein